MKEICETDEEKYLQNNIIQTIIKIKIKIKFVRQHKMKIYRRLNGTDKYIKLFST